MQIKKNKQGALIKIEDKDLFIDFNCSPRLYLLDVFLVFKIYFKYWNGINSNVQDNPVYRI